MRCGRPAGRHRRRHSRKPQRPREGRGFPMTMRNRRPAPLPSWRPSAEPGHTGRSPRLIDEDELSGGRIRLRAGPALPTPLHIRLLPLTGVRRLFLCDAVPGEEPAGSALRCLHARFPGRIRHDPLQGQPTIYESGRRPTDAINASRHAASGLRADLGPILSADRLPDRRQRLTRRIAVASSIPKRLDTPRRDIPPSTASITR